MILRVFKASISGFLYPTWANASLKTNPLFHPEINVIVEGCWILNDSFFNIDSQQKLLCLYNNQTLYNCAPAISLISLRLRDGFLCSPFPFQNIWHAKESPFLLPVQPPRSGTVPIAGGGAVLYTQPAGSSQPHTATQAGAFALRLVSPACHVMYAW